MSDLVGGTSAPETLVDSTQDEPRTIALLLLTFFALFFYSFVLVSQIHPLFHIGAADYWPVLAVIPVTLTAAIGLAFAFARFSFGYLVGFYLFTMMAGYFWLNRFSVLDYDRDQALIASVTSIVTFLLPALTLRGRAIGPRLPIRFAERAPEAVLVFSTIVLILCAIQGFHLVGFYQMDQYRSAIVRPRLIEYAIGNINGALIPFAVGICILLGRKWMAAALCVVSLLYYPITLTKTAIFTAPFLLFMAFISARFEPRIAAILSLMIPLLIGLSTIAGITWEDMNNSRLLIFSVLNFRLLSIPSISLDHYFEFFQHNPQTWFCQVSFLKPMMACPYADQIGVVLNGAYRLGNMNASLFATEGMASVGASWTPLSAFVCGLVFAIGNAASSGLPARFILISGAIIPHTLLNVPLSTTLLSNGLALLMLLWWICPRESEK